jgi:hypothetical protein
MLVPVDDVDADQKNPYPLQLDRQQKKTEAVLNGYA